MKTLIFSLTLLLSVSALAQIGGTGLGSGTSNPSIVPSGAAATGGAVNYGNVAPGAVNDRGTGSALTGAVPAGAALGSPAPGSSLNGAVGAAPLNSTFTQNTGTGFGFGTTADPAAGTTAVGTGAIAPSTPSAPLAPSASPGFSSIPGTGALPGTTGAGTNPANGSNLNNSSGTATGTGFGIGQPATPTDFNSSF